MGLFSAPPVAAEDHGHGLLQELEDFTNKMRDRIAKRRDVVRSRMASLEAESQALDTADHHLPSASA